MDENELEYEIDGLRSEVDDLQGDVYELTTQIGNQKIWDVFSESFIPYLYSKNLFSIVKKLEINSNIIKNYSVFKRLINPKLEAPHPLSQKIFDKNKDILSISNVSYLRNAKEFYFQAIRANNQTKPIFFYYSNLFLTTYLMNSTLSFNKKIPHHGIYVNIKFNGNKPNITFELRKFGFFPRLVDTLTVLGFQSSFSPIFIINNNKKDGVKYLHNKYCKFSMHVNEKFLFTDLTQYKIQNDLQEIRGEIGLCNEFNRNFKSATNFLIDYIIIFISNNIARYNPYLWNEILKGESDDLIKHIENSYNNVEDKIRFIRSVEGKIPYKFPSFEK